MRVTIVLCSYLLWISSQTKKKCPRPCPRPRDFVLSSASSSSSGFCPRPRPRPQEFGLDQHHCA